MKTHRKDGSEQVVNEVRPDVETGNDDDDVKIAYVTEIYAASDD